MAKRKRNMARAARKAPKKKKKLKKKKRKGKKLTRGSLKGGKNQPFKGKLGTGTRFSHCMAKVSKRYGAKRARKICGAIYWAKFPKGIKRR